ncbi:pantoate--beta-alanine ligase [Flavobacterium columnare NBRC 100251 = ATCC 23463]|uniref:Pantothenate synthetase n=1 Tax=Flavobacterium columnare TaxID=996 RepID=A0AAI8CI49_9FLAO|nr:pantoate--beta-alanine ligase [Flavobacterium columnare]AMO20224.1 pantoate--beta-alanine ligase [Flavobacterium columnare]ANO49448.1 pantoate--beta-alanine ligase [Flavobacterium columnare]APT22590.1 pantoate--beta-alanine ligase [Flavobacterium columnare]AUX18178.1 pantoate--beta-alanine ligase [Flavobacterium columnare]MBF6651905.1 pantoate--beta-alanine ligase [Flavobacterium columnare]
MPLFTQKSELKRHLDTFLDPKKTIGFVPTMGALHQGHLSLIEEALTDNDLAVVSIFVNPTQFNNQEDLDKYPRTLEEDLSKINTVHSNVIVYAPNIDDIYEGNTVSTHFEYDGLEFEMEGKHRPGHFDGVGTIVKKLFEIINPTNAYFGEKDFQQLQIVKKLVKNYNIPVNIVGCAIYREANGLAMSSRNQRLSPQQKTEASFIFKTLTTVKNNFHNQSPESLTKWVQEEFSKQSLFDLEYFEIAEEETLKTCTEKLPNKIYRAFIAVFVNNIRLIDNISLK